MPIRFVPILYSTVSVSFHIHLKLLLVLRKCLHRKGSVATEREYGRPVTRKNVHPPESTCVQFLTIVRHACKFRSINAYYSCQDRTTLFICVSPLALCVSACLYVRLIAKHNGVPSSKLSDVGIALKLIG